MVKTTVERESAHDALIDLVEGVMRDRGMNTNQTAKRAGIHTAELWLWMRRKRYLRSDKLVRLMMALDVRIRA
jgi:phage antirepressor YoqD-like protein